jgi:hypothetical protein
MFSDHYAMNWPRSQEAKKQEAKKPRSQEAKKPEAKKPT